ncbi:MAG: M28 family metallopeptidase [Glaciecola sp.]
MRRIVTIFSALTSLCLLSACQTTIQPSNDFKKPEVNTAFIKAHMHFLASDALEGRAPGKRGHEVASQYIAAEFKKYGVQPAGDNGTYEQRITFRKSLLDQASPTFVIHGAGEPVALTYPKDFVTSQSLFDTDASVTAELVFVGHGMVAPEYGIDDYAGLDVEGKIVVRVPGRHSNLPNEVGQHLGSSSEINKNAVSRGAVGIIVITTPQYEERRPYARALNSLQQERMDWIDANGEASRSFAQLVGSAYLPLHSAQTLFADTPVALDDIYALLAEDKAPQGFAMGKSVTLTKRSSHEEMTSPNVVGVVRGSDPVLRDEYVVFSAHHDHLGVRKSVEKDRINNGAMDNATGTATLLETARLFAALPVKPKRSVLFVAVTAEEKGLLGSDYFARYPTVDADKIVANVNLDMPLLTFDFADVIAFGSEHSTMQHYVEDAIAELGITLTPDPWPHMNLFTRSDHYSFVKQGVPSVFLMPGIKTHERGVDSENLLMNFLKTHYHSPTDDMQQPFNWTAAYNFAKVNFNIGFEIANADSRPVWHAESFFGQTFGKPYNTAAKQ